MRVLIFGSRHWTNYNRIKEVIKDLKDIYDDITIIEGGCKGADILARKAAIELGVKYIEYPADWSLGKKAGPLRNQKMIDEGKPDIAYSFHNDIENSKGSKDMLNRLIKHNIPCRISKE